MIADLEIEGLKAGRKNTFSGIESLKAAKIQPKRPYSSKNLKQKPLCSNCNSSMKQELFEIVNTRGKGARRPPHESILTASLNTQKCEFELHRTLNSAHGCVLSEIQKSELLESPNLFSRESRVNSNLRHKGKSPEQLKSVKKQRPLSN